MNLYFLRHAAALDHNDDKKRELSDTGRRQAHKVARFLRKAKVSFSAAYSSPLIRARQTAEIVLGVVNEGRPVELNFAGAMLNSTTSEDFSDWVTQLGPGGDILLVGHEPSLSERIRDLLKIPGAQQFEMKKCACACIRIGNRKSGLLKFLVTPKLIGR